MNSQSVGQSFSEIIKKNERSEKIHHSVSANIPEVQCKDTGYGVFACQYLLQVAKIYPVILTVDGDPILPNPPHEFLIKVESRPIDFRKEMGTEGPDYRFIAGSCRPVEDGEGF